MSKKDLPAQSTGREIDVGNIENRGFVCSSHAMNHIHTKHFNLV